MMEKKKQNKSYTTVYTTCFMSFTHRMLCVEVILPHSLSRMCNNSISESTLRHECTKTKHGCASMYKNESFITLNEDDNISQKKKNKFTQICVLIQRHLSILFTVDSFMAF